MMRLELVGLVLAAACHAGATGASAPTPMHARGGDRSRTATAEDWQGTSAARAEELLVGRFAGVEVLPLPGGGVSVRIRGATSLTLSTEPLYVVDGMPINTEPGGALKWLPPQEIQKIEVLKDIGSTAFYGSRGANGVILITTKH